MTIASKREIPKLNVRSERSMDSSRDPRTGTENLFWATPLLCKNARAVDHVGAELGSTLLTSGGMFT